MFICRQNTDKICHEQSYKPFNCLVVILCSTGFNIKKFYLLPSKCIFVLIRISKQTVTFTLYNIYWSVFYNWDSVYCEVRNWFLIKELHFVLKGLMADPYLFTRIFFLHLDKITWPKIQHIIHLCASFRIRSLFVCGVQKGLRFFYSYDTLHPVRQKHHKHSPWKFKQSELHGYIICIKNLQWNGNANMRTHNSPWLKDRELTCKSCSVHSDWKVMKCFQVTIDVSL